GATPAQARAALRQYNDVMRAAEKIFEGAFDSVVDDDDDSEDNAVPSTSDSKRIRTATPDDEDEDMGSDDDEGDYIDYDSDYEAPPDSAQVRTDADPYAGIFFSKDRKEEVIEVEEQPEVVQVPGCTEQVKLMTQGEWMKGCPEGGEQSFLFSLYSQLTEGKCPCPNCGAPVKRNKHDFFALYPDFLTYIQQLRKMVGQTCKACNSEFCLACGESSATDKAKRPETGEHDALFHCSNLQGVILGVGLSMLELLFIEQTQEPRESKEQNSRTTKRRKTDQTTSSSDPDDEDVAYYGILPGTKKKQIGGVGYAGDVKEDNTGQLEAQAIQRTKDEKIGNLLTEIRVYLPNLHREGGGQTSDYLVHPTALAHLRRRFNYICSTLLRNDSLADMSDRSVLYFELLHWLETISSHEALASMMAMPIMVVVSVKGVTVKKSSAKSSSSIRERTIVYEGSSSPRELLEGIAIQAQAALKGLEGTKPQEAPQEELTEEQKRMTVDLKGKAKEQTVELSDENQKLLEFCNRILTTANAIDRSLRETKGDAFVERLHASLPKVFTSSSSSTSFQVDAGTTEESAQKAYLEWASRVRFKYCDLTIPFNGEDDTSPRYKFYFNNEARMLASSDIPKRSLAIAKELAILTTNLPVAWDSSIFLRVDETRVDVIKALITGPEGTPYHNGCYLFDIFLGFSYNQSPPSVKYMTTNGGRFRFNPNLYADGKVCLSLLGTWSGPGWVSGKSTLLQVLISIQSMILCEEPYLNEPGWANQGGSPASRAYSANVRRMVMLGNLKTPPEPFEDVIRTHFRLKARSVAAQLDNWLLEDDGKSTMPDGGGYGAAGKIEPGGSTNGLKKDVDEMKALLAQLEAAEPL
ncbi:Baculoviral IAP repeat-containing protein 6, partial [Termitomyces sp. J132]